MKRLITVLIIMCVTMGNAQTPFPTGIRIGNLTEVSSADSIPIIGKNGVIKSWIKADSLKTKPIASNLQQVTDKGYVTTNPIETSSYFQGGQKFLEPLNKEYEDILKSSDGNTLLRINTSTYSVDEEGFLPTTSIFVGKNTGINASSYNSNAFGSSALMNNNGSDTNAFGSSALMDNKGAASNGFGSSALSKNIGTASNGFGYGSLSNNMGGNANGFGHNALFANLGNQSNGFGHRALGNNKSDFSNGFGHEALYKNRGRYASGFGYRALLQNSGEMVIGLGSNVLRYNNRDKNTAIGHDSFSGFYEDTVNKKDFLPSDIDAATRLITITGHGFVPATGNEHINLKYTTTGTPISGLVNGDVSQYQITSSNTISAGIKISNTGSGVHSFTPQINYTNSTTIGANSHPTASNQVTLGDENVTQVDTYGAIRSRAYGSGVSTGTATYNLATDAAGNLIEIPLSSGGASYTAGTNIQISGSNVISATDTNTTYGIFNASVDGLVPKRTGATTDKFLNETGDWVVPSGGAGNLQETTDLGYVTTNPIEVSNYIKVSGEEVLDPLVNETKILIKNSNNIPILREMKTYHNGASYVADQGLFLGQLSGNKNKAMRSNGFGEYSLRTNTGRSSNGFGRSALEQNTGSNSSGFGDSALSNNKGNDSSGFGSSSLGGNEGNSVNGFGLASLMFNKGDSVNGFGSYSLRDNTGSLSNGFGDSALSFNTGTNVNGIGHSVLRQNVGSNAVAIGSRAMSANSGDNNTAVGYMAFDGFYVHTANAKTINTADVVAHANTITVSDHGFGTDGSIVILRHSTSGGSLSYNNFEVIQFKIVDSNTLEAVQPFTVKTAGNFVLTPSLIYTNTTAIGANSRPNRSNQVMLGSNQIAQVAMGNGAVLSAFETPDTFALLDLSSTGGNLCNMRFANGNTDYSVTKMSLNGYAKVLINTASEPTIVGARKISGATWVAGTNMYLIVRYMGMHRGVEYKFESI